MNIVLDERDWAEERIRNHDIVGNVPETLSRVAKYYAEEGHSRKEIRRLTELFLVSCRPNANLSEWAKVIDIAVNNAKKYPLLQLDGIPVTHKELEQIRVIRSGYERKLAFTLLCLAKYWDIRSPKNNHWVNCKDSDIFKMANISTSVIRQCELYASLRERGLIRFSRKIDNLNVQVLFTDEGGEAEVLVSDFRCLGNYFCALNGGDYYACQNCGILVRRKTSEGRRPKYCSVCAKDIKNQQTLKVLTEGRKIGKYCS